MALIGSLTSGVSALESFEKGLEVIGDNIANVNTTGFKASRVQYADNFSNILQQSAPTSTTGSGSDQPAEQIGTGVSVASITSNFKQGTLTSTGINTDLGISGNGFFQVRDAGNNIDYVTRAGNFRLDSQGYLVTNDNYSFRVQGLTNGSVSYVATDVNGALVYTPTATPPSTVGDIKIGFNISIGNGLTNSTGGAFTDAQVSASAPTMQSFTVDHNGNVVVGLSNGDTFDCGQVLLQDFNDTSALMRVGNNLYSGINAAGPKGGIALSAANNSPESNGLGAIQSGALEGSNVDLSNEFADLITTQRAFQAGSRIITVSDTVLDDVINLKRQ
jgi:flagellar hook protein FlgE